MATAVSTKDAPPSANGSESKVRQLVVSPPNFQDLQVTVRGTSALLQCRFSKKAQEQIRGKQAAGSVAAKGAKREARDFDADLMGALHVSESGWFGIPASAFRNACIEACRTAGFTMTRARMSIFILDEGKDSVDGIPLVRIISGPYERTEMMTRNATGVVDIRVRPMWREWSVNLKVRFDADQFSPTDVLNLLMRAGIQVGVGEGRPFSKNSNGMGFGTFTVEAGVDSEPEEVK